MKLKIGKSIQRLRRLVNMLVGLASLFYCYFAHADYRPDVVYSGIAYLGNYGHIQQNYPYALALNQSDGPADMPQVGGLDRFFLSQINTLAPQYYQLQFDLADLKKGQSIAMALAIESENISTEVIGNNRKIIVEASAQLLFFDFANMSLLANYPVSMAKNHVLAKELDYQQQLTALFRDLYVGNEHKSGLLGLAAEVAGRASLDVGKSLRFQLAQVSTEPKVESQLPAHLSVQRFNQFIGQYFSARLANQYRIAVLPFTKGYAIGNQMAGRFANGNVFNLNLPPPDYTFELQIAGLKKAPFKDNLMYASLVGLRFSQQASNKLYFDELFQYAVPKLVTTNMSEIDDWSAFQDAIEVLIDDLVAQLGQPQKAWFKTHSQSGQAYKNFKTKQVLFTAL